MFSGLIKTFWGGGEPATPPKAGSARDADEVRTPEHGTPARKQYIEFRSPGGLPAQAFKSPHTRSFGHTDAIDVATSTLSPVVYFGSTAEANLAKSHMRVHDAEVGDIKVNNFVVQNQGHQLVTTDWDHKNRIAAVDVGSEKVTSVIDVTTASNNSAVEITHLETHLPDEAYERSNPHMVSLTMTYNYKLASGLQRHAVSTATLDSRDPASMRKIAKKMELVLKSTDPYVGVRTTNQGFVATLTVAGELRLYTQAIDADSKADLLVPFSGNVLEDGLDMSFDGRWILVATETALYALYFEHGEEDWLQYRKVGSQRPEKPHIIKLLFPEDIAQEMDDDSHCQVRSATIVVKDKDYKNAHEVDAVVGRYTLRWSLEKVKAKYDAGTYQVLGRVVDEDDQLGSDEYVKVERLISDKMGALVLSEKGAVGLARGSNDDDREAAEQDDDDARRRS